jgi:alpha/beta superfamily hydrolase
MSNSQHSFYFGTPGNALLGVYYPPSSAVTQRNHSIILCPAFGQEYLRSHRAFRQLAMLLAREGFHVLRFDYFGTGDSEGSLEDATIEHWLADISAAASELINITGCETQSLIGLRLGATLALMQSAASTMENWHSITLWEPLVNGEKYLADSGDTVEQPLTNIMGFPLHQKLRDEIAAIDLTGVDSIGTKRLNCITSTSEEGLESMLNKLGESVSITQSVIPINGDWARHDEFLSAMLPREMILRIVAGLTEAAGS